MPTSPKVFVLIGETGSGKSTFINLIAGKEIAKVGKEFHPCTRKVEQHNLKIRRKDGGTEVVIVVDTPGLNSPKKRLTDADIVQKIQENLVGIPGGAQFGALVFFHDLMDGLSRTTAIPHAPRSVNLTIVEKWPQANDPSYATCQKHAQKLHNTTWEKLLRAGATKSRLEETSESAQRLIEELLLKQPVSKEGFLKGLPCLKDNATPPKAKKGILVRLFGVDGKTLTVPATTYKNLKESIRLPKMKPSFVFPVQVPTAAEGEPFRFNDALAASANEHSLRISRNADYIGDSLDYGDNLQPADIQVLGANNALEHVKIIGERLEKLLCDWLGLSSTEFTVEAGFNASQFLSTARLSEEIYIQLFSSGSPQMPLPAPALDQIGKALAPFPGRIVFADATEIPLPAYDKRGNRVDLDQSGSLGKLKAKLPLRTKDIVVADNLVVYASTVEANPGSNFGDSSDAQHTASRSARSQSTTPDEEHSEQSGNPLTSSRRPGGDREAAHPTSETEPPRSDRQRASNVYTKPGDPGDGDPPARNGDLPYIYFNVTSSLYSREGDDRPLQDLQLVGRLTSMTSTDAERALATVEFKRVKISSLNRKQHAETFNLDIVWVAVNTRKPPSVVTEVSDVWPKTTEARGRIKEETRVLEHNIGIGGSNTGASLSLGRKTGSGIKENDTTSRIIQEEVDGGASWHYVLEPDTKHDRIEISGDPQCVPTSLSVDTTPWPRPFVQFAFWGVDGIPVASPSHLEMEIVSFWSAKKESTLTHFLRRNGYRNMVHRLRLRFPSNLPSHYIYEGTQDVVLQTPQVVGTLKPTTMPSAVDVKHCSSQIVNDNSPRRWTERTSASHGS